LTPNIRLSFGGADRDRTGGLLVANQALSQLSYSPLTTVASFQLSVTRKIYWKLAAGNWRLILVGLGRVELPTSPLSGVRSSHLSYRPGFPIVHLSPSDAGLLAFSSSLNLIGSAKSQELIAKSLIYFRGKG
jgi:hypothetical protein